MPAKSPPSWLLATLSAFVAVVVLVAVVDFEADREPPVHDQDARANEAGSRPLGKPVGAASEAEGAKPVREVNGIPDPDGIGACPKFHSPVVRQCRDRDGQPTWWHEDGSITMIVQQTYTEGSERSIVESTVVIRPTAERKDSGK